jgi:hypothetical protein
MASAKKFRALQKRNKRANHGRRPGRGRPRSQFKNN